MSKRQGLFSIGIALLFLICFFFPIFSGKIPFPGDLLLGEYQPWRSYSFQGYAAGGIPNKAQYFDSLRQIYPWKSLVSSQLRQGQIPWWNPYNFSGAPLLANIQSAVFSPTHLGFLWFSKEIAWTLAVVGQHLIALLGVFWYCRQRKLSQLASWFAALTYAFSSFSIVWSQYTTIIAVIAYLPWLLYLIERLRYKSTSWFYPLLAGIVAASGFSGHLQVFGGVLAVSFTYLLLIRIPLKNKILITSAIILGLGVAAIQLIPTLELLLHSARSPYTYQFMIEKNLVQPWQLITMLIPDFFGNPASRNYWLSDTYVAKVLSGGVATIIFLTILLQKKKQRFEYFWFGLAATTILVITRTPLTEILYRLPLPFLNASSPTLFTFILTLSFSILSGVAITRIQQKESFSLRQSILPISLLLGSLLTLVLLAKKTPLSLLSQNANVTLRNLLFWMAIWIVVSLLTTALKYVRWKNWLLIAIIVIHLSELLYSFRKFNPFVPASYLFPTVSVLTALQEKQGYDRYWSFGSGTIEANFATAFGLHAIDGYDPLYPKWYGEFIYANQTGRLLDQFTRKNRSDAVIDQSERLLDQPYRKRILDVLSVKYYLQKDEDGPRNYFPETFPTVYRQDGWMILENRDVLPRVFFAKQFSLYESKLSFEEQFFSTDFNPRETVLLASAPTTNFEPPVVTDTVYLAKESPNQLTILSNSLGPRLIYISDTFYPGWKATSNTLEIPIYRANYSFRAIVVPAGQQEIILSYESTSSQVGIIITGLAGVILIGWYSIGRIKTPKPKKVFRE